jgi:hypothetical protein
VLCDDDWTVITADGSWAAHFEHTVAITAEGPWVLTAEESTPGNIPNGLLRAPAPSGSPLGDTGDKDSATP